MKFSLVTSSGSFARINKKTGLKFRTPANIAFRTLEELIAFSNEVGHPLVVRDGSIEIYDDWRE